MESEEVEVELLLLQKVQEAGGGGDTIVQINLSAPTKSLRETSGMSSFA